MCSQQSQSWSRDAVVALIDAYKQESGLYDVSSANYHNKHLRAEALNRVSTAVSSIRAETSGKECATKFYNMRNQFNIENIKVKASVKSGAGTENIYKPSLWYFELMKFVEEHVVPRKSVSSKLPNSRRTVQEPENDRTAGPSAGCSSNISCNGFSENGELNVFVDEDSDTAPAASQSATTSQNSSESSTSQTYASSPDESSTVSFTQTARNQKRRKIQGDDAYISAIASIAESLKQPVVIPAVNNTPSSTDPIDTCMAFIGSILKGFESVELRLEVMNALVQTAINAKTADFERAKRK